MHMLSFNMEGVLTRPFSPTFKMYEKQHNSLIFSTTKALPSKAMQKILEIHNKIFYYITSTSTEMQFKTHILLSQPPIKLKHYQQIIKMYTAFQNYKIIIPITNLKFSINFNN